MARSKNKPERNEKGKPGSKALVAAAAVVAGVVVVALIIIFLAHGNEQTPSEMLVGKWSWVSSARNGAIEAKPGWHQTIQFNDGGGFEMDTNGTNYSGIWQDLGNGQLTMTLPGSPTLTYSYTVSASALTMRNTDDFGTHIHTYSRIG